MWPPPYHTKALAEHDWTLWLEANTKRMPNLVTKSRRWEGSGSKAVGTTWGTVFTLPEITDATEALLRYCIGDGFCSYRVRRNGIVEETIASPARAMHMSLLQDLVPGDVLDVQAKDDFGATYDYVYLLEESRNPTDYSDKVGLPAPRYQNTDPRWYGYWTDLYSTMLRVNTLRGVASKHEDAEVKETRSITLGTTYDLVSLTSTAKGDLRIHVYTHSWHNFLELYKDGVLFAALLGNIMNHTNLREGIFYDVGDGNEHEYTLKGVAVVTVTANVHAAIHILAT